MHAFDQTTNDGVPYRYTKEGIAINGRLEYSICPYDMETSNGEMLHSGSVMMFQKSCRAMTGNAGNYYSWTTATIGARNVLSQNEEDSVCARGWKIPTNADSSTQTYDYLFRNVYNITAMEGDNNVQFSPFSFVRAGFYGKGTFIERGSNGRYHTSTETGESMYYLFFHSSMFDVAYLGSKADGRSVRCVSR